MDEAHSWHPGTRRVASRWAVPVDLLPDEIFSSWLVRAALANGCDPMVFTGAIWPRWRVWIGDLDRNIPDERLAVLAKESGIRPEAFKGALLRPVFLSVMDEEPPLKSGWPWLIPTGSRNRKRSDGLQYCPRCLAEDRTPYYRLQWRFSWHTVCPKHGCGLLDRCPHCSAVLEPHRLVLGTPHIGVCFTCGGVLADAPVEIPKERYALRIQEATDNAIRNGGGETFGERVTVRGWFAMLRFWNELIRMSMRSETVAMSALAQQWPSGVDRVVGKVCFGGQSVSQRRAALDNIGWLMSMSYGELLLLTGSVGLSRQNLLLAGKPPLIAIARLADELPARRGIVGAYDERCKGRRSGPPPPKSRRQVEWQMTLLRRKMAGE